MPMARYQIRNEYSLADPQLYTTADKDDPEALLEGVAMAGLVGLLRQLGDLAEFASEIFHGLHEEVMVAASRGHNLKSRVQQLETEVLSVEKSFLARTDHSLSLYNTGLGWHPNLRVDHNLVTQGDFPRFIMDSYEECRGPPRLFLLDKFDVAGDGACLKRYSDPAIFKVETVSMQMNGADMQREKKIRRAKKKGPQLRNGETPEALPQSHAKLHQLFMEEHLGNTNVNPSRRVKLKRRLNGFPFDLRTGQSYMGKLLNTFSAETKLLHEVTDMSSQMILSADDHNDHDLGIDTFRSTTPDIDSVELNITPAPPHEDIIRTSSMHDSEVVSMGKEAENPCPSIWKDDDQKTCNRVAAENDTALAEEKITEVGLISYISDESEIDSYVDAPISMESEVDTDSELRIKNTSKIESQTTINDVHSSGQQCNLKFSPSRSGGNPIDSHDGNYSPKKEVSLSFSFIRSSSSAQGTESENYFPAKDSLSGDIPEIENNNSSSYSKIAYEDVPMVQNPKSLTSGDESDSGIVLKEVISREPESDTKSCILDQEVKKTNFAVDPAGSPSFSDSDSQSGDSIDATSPDFLQEDSDQEGMSGDPDEKSFTLTEKEKENLTIDPACSFNVSDSELMLGDNSSSSSAGYNSCSKNKSCLSTDCDIIRVSTDFDISSDIRHEGNTSKKDLHLGEDLSSMLKSGGIHPSEENDTRRMISSENPVKNKLNDVVLKLPENCTIDNPLIVRNGENFISGGPEEGKVIVELDIEARNVFPTALSDSSCAVDAFSGNEFGNASLANTQTTITTENESDASSINHIVSPDLTLPCLKCSQDRPMTNLAGNVGDYIVIHDDQTIVNEPPVVESHEFNGLQVTGITDDISSHDSESFGSPAQEKMEFLMETISTEEKDENPPCMSSNRQGAVESSVSAVLTPLDNDIVLSNDPNPKKNTLDVSAAAPAPADIVVEDDVCPPLVRDKLSDEAKFFFESSCDDELENDKNVLSESQRESNPLEDVIQRGVSHLDTGGVFCDTSNRNLLAPDINLAVGQSFDSIHNAGSSQTSMNQSSFTMEQKSSQQIDILSDVHSHDELVPIFQEHSGLQPGMLHVEFVDSDETDKDLSPLLTFTDEKSLNCNDNGLASVSSSSLENYPRPPFVSEFPSQHNSAVIASGDSKYPLVSTLPHSNLFLHANGIDPEELPPLPPLPPMQWRMGKFHLANPISERETIQPKELASQKVLTSFEPPIHLSSMHEELNQSDVQISQSSASNEEKAEHKSRTKATDLPLKTGTSSSEIELILSAEDEIVNDPGMTSNVEGFEHRFSSLSVSHKHEMVNDKQELIIASEVTSRRDGVEHGLDDIHKHRMENEQELIATEVTSRREGVERSLDDNHKHEMENEKQELIATAVTSRREGLELDGSHKHEIEDEKQDLSTATEMISQREEVEHSLGVSNKHEKENEIQRFVISTKIPSRKDGVEHCSTSLDSSNQQKTENDKQLFIDSSLRTEVLAEVAEDENANANANQKKKLPLPRNPLVDDLTTLDKSKLRKVTERVRPEIQKVNERDSFLEQIRTKSFNLRPAVATRPSIRGPRTNLKVTAILEKANAIRQALAGSDEDEEDSWSDS